nr:carboxypeptidase-like regulatory domain-containing protein [Haliscomenobacter sp.]
MNKKRLKNLFLCFWACIPFSLLSAQTTGIKGKVSDTNQEPLIGASVLIKGTTQGTITDIGGDFTLQVPPNTILVVSYTGFSTKEVTVGNLTQLDIVLEPENLRLDEVVVVGYGT